MFTATIRGMLAHKLRLVLTTASIALGVAFLAGTLMLTDTLKVAFEQLFGKVSSGTDAVVRHEAAYAEAAGVGTNRPPIAAAVLDQVRAVDGVAAAEGAVSGYALLTDTDGQAVLTSGGAPTMGYSMPRDAGLRGDVNLRSGHAPRAPHEVAIDASSAEDNDIPLGSTIKVLFRGPAEEFTVVGTVGFGDEKDLGGTSAAYFEPATAQRVLGRPGTFDEIRVRAVDGVSDAELARRLDAVAPDRVEAVTGAKVAEEASDAINDQFAFLGIMFSTFAGVALFVGAFIIWNTFTMIVTQRSREIALLRAVGATRRQVKRSLLVEAALLGVSASAVGIVLGAGVAKALNLLMSAIGFSLPSASLQVAPRTIWVSLLVGTAVTVVAAMVPARRATKVLPVEALRDATPGAKEPSRVRAALGLVLTGGGVAAMLHGLYGGGDGRIAMLGMAAAMVGVVTLSQLAARPLASLIGAPLRWRGVQGDLARLNAKRNPRRTASTAAALMIGLALVVSMGVFAASFKASVGPVFDKHTNGDLYLTSASGTAGGYSPEATRVAAAVPGVDVVSPTWWGQARIAGGGIGYASVDPTTVERAFNLDIVSGSARLGDDGLMVAKNTAKAEGWAVGDVVPVEFPATGAVDLQVRGIFENNRVLESEFLISLATQEANVADRLDGTTVLIVDRGADVQAVKDRIEAALAGHPDAKVLDQAGFEKEIAGFVDSLLTLVSAMLLLAVVIALLGIVNTLALSVFERTRELGLLRAIGMTRGQVRSMVRWESVVISLVGAVLGAGLGIGLGMAMAKSLESDGVSQIVVPVTQVAACLVGAAVAGVLAAVGPARAAARVDVLRAVVTD